MFADEGSGCTLPAMVLVASTLSKVSVMAYDSPFFDPHATVTIMSATWPASIPIIFISVLILR